MKKLSLISVLLFSSLITVSCGSDDDDNGSLIEREEAEGKNLFSVWRDTEDDTSFALDFREYSFNREAPFFLRTSQTIVCSCSIEFDGAQRNGNIFVRDCTGADACLDIIDTYTYEKDQNSLVICDSRNDCDTYE